MSGRPPYATPGKNSLGLGPNATGFLLGAVFFGVYFGSSYLTRKWVMQESDIPEPPKYFRDMKELGQGSKDK